MTTHLQNIFAPESTPTRAIVDLSVLVLSITAVIFVVVASLLVYAIVKFRATPANADREPAQEKGEAGLDVAADERRHPIRLRFRPARAARPDP